MWSYYLKLSDYFRKNFRKIVYSVDINRNWLDPTDSAFWCWIINSLRLMQTDVVEGWRLWTQPAITVALANPGMVLVARGPRPMESVVHSTSVYVESFRLGVNTVAGDARPTQRCGQWLTARQMPNVGWAARKNL